jgi:hypothetical protein
VKHSGAWHVDIPDLLHMEVPEVVREWMAAGEMQEAFRLILMLGAELFGPAPVGTEAALREITDRARLERMAVRVIGAAGWPDVLTTT